MKPVYPLLQPNLIPRVMSYSPPLIPFIKAYESLHDGDLTQIGLQPKLDPVGYWTEGYGRLMTVNGKPLRVENFPTIESVLPYSIIKTEEDAEKELRTELNATVKGVFKRLKKPLEQHQFDALVSHAYNCGYSSTLYTLINGGAKESAIKNWFTNKYITANGVYLKGLQYRRNDEYEIWAGINYEREYKLSI